MNIGKPEHEIEVPAPVTIPTDEPVEAPQPREPVHVPEFVPA